MKQLSHMVLLLSLSLVSNLYGASTGTDAKALGKAAFIALKSDDPRKFAKVLDKLDALSIPLNSITDKDGSSLLHVAVIGGNLPMLDAMVGRTTIALINDPVILLALFNPNFNARQIRDIVKRLVNIVGVDVNAQDDAGNVPLVFAVVRAGQEKKGSPGRLQALETIRLLIDRQADPFKKNHQEKDAFTIAGKNKDKEVLAELSRAKLVAEASTESVPEEKKGLNIEDAAERAAKERAQEAAERAAKEQKKKEQKDLELKRAEERKAIKQREDARRKEIKEQEKKEKKEAKEKEKKEKKEAEEKAQLAQQDREREQAEQEKKQKEIEEATRQRVRAEQAQRGAERRKIAQEKAAQLAQQEREREQAEQEIKQKELLDEAAEKAKRESSTTPVTVDSTPASSVSQVPERAPKRLPVAMPTLGSIPEDKKLNPNAPEFQPVAASDILPGSAQPLPLFQYVPPTWDEEKGKYTYPEHDLGPDDPEFESDPEFQRKWNQRKGKYVP